jgi:hypothetical protein
MIEMANTLRLHFLLRPGAAKENLESGSIRLGATGRPVRAGAGCPTCVQISANQSRAEDIAFSRPARSF